MKGGEDGLTIGELNQLHSLKEFIAHEKDRLDDLRASLQLKSPVLSDMPKAPGARDKVGETVPKIVDEEQMILDNIAACEQLRERLMGYIQSIDDLKLRHIMILRFIDDLPWTEVADRAGGNETENSVKNAVYRHVNRTNIENPDL
jgi:hypothetical protein